MNAGHPEQRGHQIRLAHCCPCGQSALTAGGGLTRRSFLGGLSGAALTGLAWPLLAAADAAEPAPAPTRRPLVVKPVFAYSTYTRQHQTSWRPWGGIQTQADAEQELGRIGSELAALRARVDFPLELLPVSPVRSRDEVMGLGDLANADVLLVYASDGGSALDALAETKKDVVFFIRHQSGPVYLWYEIIHPRYLRQHTDEPAIPAITYDDVVIDSYDEVVWRLRALCGLRNAMGTRILAVGGPSGWGPCGADAPELSRDRWGFELHTVSYDELRPLVRAALADEETMGRCRRRAGAYLQQGGVSLETERSFVDNAFLLEEVFLGLMAKVGATAFTINECMGTIMPVSDTTACLTLTLLNDSGYNAFCESDFVVIPSGILLAGISGRPVFLNDPTYPHDGIITLAHCTAPRKLDGSTLEPARIMTHFESDYGAAPKVEMRKGQRVTNILPDFKAERWVGVGGEILDHPFMPICRSQIEVRLDADSRRVADMMPGFHWMTVYGDYLRETGYALRRTKIAWECLA